MYKLNMHIVFSACCSPPAELFFSRFRLRGKQGVRRYITKRVCILAELRGVCLKYSKSLSRLFCK